MKVFFFILIIFFDQLSKYGVNQYIPLNNNIIVTPFFDIINIRNTGIAFGLFSNVISPWIILVVVGIINIIIFIWLIRTKNNLEKTGLTMIIAGGLGNFIDRLIHNYVIDFFYFHINDYYWPAFNIADIAITLGIILLIFATYMSFKFNVKENQ